MRRTLICAVLVWCIVAGRAAFAADMTFEQMHPMTPAPNTIVTPSNEEMKAAILTLKNAMNTETTAQKRGKAILDFFSVSLFGAPSRHVLAWNTSFGKNVNLLSYVVEFSPCRYSQGFEKLLERYFVGIIALTYFDRAINGQPIATDFIFDMFGMLLGKIGGSALGPASAIMFFTKAGLDNIGADTIAMIDARMYADFKAYHLNQHPNADWYIDQVNNKGGPQHLARTLVSLYVNRSYGDKDVDYVDHGMYIMKHAKPDYREAVAAKYIREVVFPLMRDKAEADAQEAEIDLIFRVQAEAAGFYKREMIVHVPGIYDADTMKPPTGVRALLAYGDQTGRTKEYLVAETMVGPKGAVFRFPPGKLINPETKEAMMYLSCYLVPKPPADFLGNTKYEWFKIDLRYQHPRTEKTRDGELTIYTNKTRKRVDMAWPVTIALNGQIPKPPMHIRVGAWRVKPPASGLRTITSVSHQTTRSEGNRASFKELRSGAWIFTLNDRPVARALIDKPTSLTLNVPGPVPLNAPYPQVPMPDVAGGLAKAKATMAEELNFNKMVFDLTQSAGETLMGVFDQIMVAQIRANEAMEINFRKRDRIREDVPRDQQKAVYDRFKADAKAISDLQKKIQAQQQTVWRELMDQDLAIDKARRAREDELRATVTAAREELKQAERKADALETEVTVTMRDVFFELAHNYSVYQGDNADAQIAALEQRVNALGDKMAEWGQTIATASAARDRMAGAMEEQGKIELVDDTVGYIPRINEQAAGFDDLKNKIEHLKKTAAEQKTKDALVVIKKRHEIRRKNEREIAQLMRDAQRIINDLPGWNGGKWQGELDRYGREFDKLLNAGDAAKLRGLAQRINATLDGSKRLTADLLLGRKRGATPFSEFRDKMNRVESLLNSGLCYFDMGRINRWNEMKSEVEKKDAPRRKTIDALAELAVDAERAGANPDAYRQRIAAAEATVTDGFKALEDPKLDTGTRIDTLDNVWRAADKLSGPRANEVRDKVRAMGDAIAADGRKLVAWAEQAKRPLIVFETMSTYNQQHQKVGQDVTLNGPVLTVPRDKTGYVMTKAKLVGVPKGKGVSLFIDDGYRQRIERRTFDGTYNFAIHRNMPAPELKLLAGKDAGAVAYPWLRQVVMK